MWNRAAMTVETVQALALRVKIRDVQVNVENSDARLGLLVGDIWNSPYLEKDIILKCNEEYKLS